MSPSMMKIYIFKVSDHAKRSICVEETDPTPAFVAANAIHLGNSEGKKTRECSTRGSGGIKNGNSTLCLIREIPFRYNEHSARKKASPMENVGLEFCITISYKGKAHSKSPKRSRITTRSAKFLTNPVHVIMIPQRNISAPKYRDGLRNRFNIMLLGTSSKLLTLGTSTIQDSFFSNSPARTYGMKNTESAMLY